MQENQVRLFKEIIQFSALELQQGKGSGLGLFIAKQIIDANNGTIGVISKGLGMGTSFFFELPLVRDAGKLAISNHIFLIF